MFQQVLCSAIEKIINQALALNLQGPQVLSVLDAKSLTIYLDELTFPLHFIINAQYVSVISNDDSVASESDCQITTSLKTLKELKKNQKLTELIKQDKLAINGDIKIAQQVAHIAENITIDWRSELAKNIGDIPTYKISQFTQFVFDKVSFASKQIQADASEWLVHEKRLAVTSSQIALHNQAVTDISTDAAALTARVDKLLNMNNSNTQG